MSELTTRLIVGACCSPETLELILQDKPHYRGAEHINFSVFEATLGSKTVYCCWAGGHITNGQLHLTPVGRGAVEALMGMPLGQNETLVFQELKLGKTPLRDKVVDCLRRVGPATKVCFVGDLAGALDGRMSPAFNVCGDPIIVGAEE